jgi:outer membrane protein OmpA-like peptidoglycan-associated protein
MAKINQNGNHSTYGLDAKRKLIYVYLDYYTDFNTSIAQMQKVRGEGVFHDAWVRIMKDGLDENVNLLTQTTPDPKEEPAEVASAQAEKVETVEPKEVEPVKIDVAAANETSIEQPAVVAEEVIDNPKPEPVIPPQLLSNTPVFLSLYNDRNNQVVEGEVDVIDVERARAITTVKGNDYITLPDPKSNSGELILICKAFGYRPVEHKINYIRTESDTLKDYIDLVGNYYMVKFNLVRIHKGDIVTLFNVYFYNDAAIMLPESKYQLNSLLQMMEETPTYKIRLHGHTNGNSKGRIITIGPSKSFFALADDVKEGFGSAKDLSGARAEVIKAWLISEGVGEDRIEIRAWGGKRMVHDKHSVNAKKNVRVDVEVIEE